MNAKAFFSAIRRFIEANATEPRPGLVANNLTVIVNGYELSIEGRSRGTGFVTICKDHQIIANECELYYCFDEDQCINAVLAIIEAQNEQKAEAAREAFATERAELAAVPLQRIGVTTEGFRRIEKMLGFPLSAEQREKFNRDFIAQCQPSFDGIRFDGVQPK